MTFPTNLASRTFALLLALLFIIPMQGQTFLGSGGAIPDNGEQVEFPLLVAGLIPDQIDTMTFGLEQVCLTITHSWLEDLDVWIVAPNGMSALLVSALGSNTNNYTSSCFRQNATQPITSGAPPFTGTFRPMGQMGLLNDQGSGNGIWKLRILDTYAFADTGDLIQWSITFGDQPATYVFFTTSNLPLVVINTYGHYIPDEPKIMGTMGIVYNGPGMLNSATGPFNEYQGHIGIERRGWSSAGAPKKSYGVELREQDGTAISAGLLGMPAEEDWVLSANYYDKSLLNNTLSYTIAREMGRYAARHHHVEVILNGEYIGVYVLMERIKRGADRVDIAKLDSTEISGENVTGGYIIKIDKFGNEDGGWDSPYDPVVSPAGQRITFLYVYPKTSRIQPEQEEYIQAYVDSFETALAGTQFRDPILGYSRYMEQGSFVDLFLLNELSRNVDGYRLSTYLHKEKNSRGGKLRIGPAWDYDIAWGNANYCQGYNTSGWAYQFGQVCPGDDRQVPFWWHRLLQDPAFTNAIRCRWEELKSTTLSIATLHTYCDQKALDLNEAQGRNFTRWPILGVPVWPNPTPVPVSYAGEIQELKDFISARWNWLDQNLPGGTNCANEDVDRVTFIPYPVPFDDHIVVGWFEETQADITLYDILGRSMLNASMKIDPSGTRIEMPAGLPAGSYLLQMRTARGQMMVFRLQH